MEVDQGSIDGEELETGEEDFHEDVVGEVVSADGAWPQVPITAAGLPNVTLAKASFDYDVLAHGDASLRNRWALAVPVCDAPRGFIAAFPDGVELPPQWPVISATVAVRNEVQMEDSTDVDMKVTLALVPALALADFRLVQETAPSPGDVILFSGDDEMPHAASLVSVGEEWRQALEQQAAVAPLPAPAAAAPADPARGRKRPTVAVLTSQISELMQRLDTLEGAGAQPGWMTPRGGGSDAGTASLGTATAPRGALQEAPASAGAAVRAPQSSRGKILSGYAQSKRTAAQAAEDARQEAAALLAGAGIATGAPQPERSMRPKPQTRAALAAPRLPEPTAPVAGLLLNTIASQVAAGAEPDARMLRIAELQVLTQLAGSIAPKREAHHSSDLLNDDFGADSAAPGGLTMSRGTETLQRVQQSRERDPQRWSQSFDMEIQRELFTTVTGRPWCLLDYVLKRMKFRHPQDDDLEHVTHIMCALHACHRKGADSHAELGMLVGQFFKAIEARHRDGDWLVAWTMTGLPDPQPRAGFARGLAHPAEYAAGIAKMRELQMVSQYRTSLTTAAAAANPRGQLNPVKKEPYDRDKAGKGGKSDKGGKGKGKDKDKGAADGPT